MNSTITIVVMSGDNGWPFPRGKATKHDSAIHLALAIPWGALVQPGRVAEDFVSLADLAPTFLEAANVPVPSCMPARSLRPILCAVGSGQVDAPRDHVLTGMETHVPCRELDGQHQGGYPRRAITTRDFHYNRNSHAERWPASDPRVSEIAHAQLCTMKQLVKSNRTADADIDACPATVLTLISLPSGLLLVAGRSGDGKTVTEWDASPL